MGFVSISQISFFTLCFPKQNLRHEFQKFLWSTLKGTVVETSLSWVPPERDSEQRSLWTITPLQSKFPTPRVPVQAYCKIRVWGPLFFIGSLHFHQADRFLSLQSVGCLSLTSIDISLGAVLSDAMCTTGKFKKSLVSLTRAKTSVSFHILLFRVSRCTIPFLVSRDGCNFFWLS